jgi:hypothetical protein
VNLAGLCLHYGNTRIADNLMLVGNQAAVVASGAVLDGSVMALSDNVIYTAGTGIQAGVDGLAIERNDIFGFGARSGDGIQLLEGLDPVAMSNARISDNRLQELGGNAIAITHRVENLRISGNHIERIGLAALLMNKGASANYLDFSSNQCEQLGLALANLDGAFAALQLIRVERGDLRDNRVAMVALQAVASAAIDGLRVAAVGQLRIAGNRFYGIGPDRISGSVNALHLLTPFDRVAIDDNSVERIGSTAQKPALIEWRAINIHPDQSGDTGYAAAAYFSAGEVAYMLTNRVAIAFPRLPAVVSIRGNQLRGHSTRVPLNQCVLVDECLFAENRCEVIGEFGKEPIDGEITARTINASNNRLIGPGDLVTLLLNPQAERAVVIGNISNGGIQVSGGSIPTDINLTNMIGV